MIFQGKHILLGVTGSIAAYKSCLVLRDLQRMGAEVRVIMTESAQKFVGRWTFESLTRHEVITELFPEYRNTQTKHISWAEWADCLLICPATANIVGKIANGIADDFLTTTAMAVRCPIVIAPAMDLQMIQNPIYIENCERLKRHRISFVETGTGDLASGLIGPGRLAGSKKIIHEIRKTLSKNKSLSGKRVLVTAGPTREYLDPIRFLTNKSSGKMGFALAEEAVLRGSDVTLIHGPVQQEILSDITSIPVESVQEMHDAVSSAWKDHDILVMNAAVGDYRPKNRLPEKIKKTENNLSITLERTQDILKSVAAEKTGKIIVGFALETENGEANASRKLKEKNLDLICLNAGNQTASGIGEEHNQITLIDKAGLIEKLPELLKWQAAQKIWDKVECILNENRKGK